MRGCLSFIVLVAVLLAGAVWVVGPPVASSLATVALQGSGLSADRLDVKVTADPPLELAVGRADSMTIHATGAHWRGVALATLDVTLGAVDLLGRTATTAAGRLQGVELDTAGGQTVLADVDIHGSAAGAATTIRVDAATVMSIAISAFDTHFSVRPSAARLVAPNTIQVVLGGLTVNARLSIGAKGSVVATTGGDTIVLFTPSAALPLHLTSLAATPTGLTLRGTLDVDALLH